MPIEIRDRASVTNSETEVCRMHDRATVRLRESEGLRRTIDRKPQHHGYSSSVTLLKIVLHAI